MAEFDDLFTNVQNLDEFEDKSLYIRHTPSGPVVDFETIERTNYARDIPETTKEIITQGPLPCGHSLTRENPHGGFCGGRSFLCTKQVCGKEYCSLCTVACPRCGTFVSRKCHTVPWNGELYCTVCRQKLFLLQLFTLGIAFLLKPFLQKGQETHEPSKNETEPYSIQSPEAGEWEQRHFSVRQDGKRDEINRQSSVQEIIERNHAQKGSFLGPENNQKTGEHLSRSPYQTQ